MLLEVNNEADLSDLTINGTVLMHPRCYTSQQEHG